MLNEHNARREIETELQIEPGLDAASVKVSVQDRAITVTGHVVTLTGEVDWEFQKALIERTVRRQSDVIGVANLIQVRQPTVGRAIQEKLVSACRQIAETDSRQVRAAVDNGLRTLSCKVRVARARRRDSFWSVSGVSRLSDQLVAS
jgi:osmotically-inducible protein OsmY